MRLEHERVEVIRGVGKNTRGMRLLKSRLTWFGLRLDMPESEIEKAFGNHDYTGNDRLREILREEGEEGFFDQYVIRFGSKADHTTTRHALRNRGIHDLRSLLEMPHGMRDQTFIWRLLPYNLTIAMPPELITIALRTPR